MRFIPWLQVLTHSLEAMKLWVSTCNHGVKCVSHLFYSLLYGLTPLNIFHLNVAVWIFSFFCMWFAYRAGTHTWRARRYPGPDTWSGFSFVVYNFIKYNLKSSVLSAAWHHFYITETSNLYLNQKGLRVSQLYRFFRTHKNLHIQKAYAQS